MSDRVSFFTFGCRLNQAETATLGASFRQEGFSVVPYGEPCDIVVVNTCTITENGDADTRKLVNRVARKQPQANIALIGCQAQMQAKALAGFKSVAWVVGNARKMELPTIIRKQPASDEVVVLREPPSRKPFTQPVIGREDHRTRANLKVQDGCDFFCSFCVVPFARGRARGREFDDILHEGKALVDAGFREIVITGVNVGTYQLETYGFADVVDALSAIPGLDRLRISSIEPTTIAPDILHLIQTRPNICRYLHVPIQSGNDTVLTRMARKYTTADFLDFMSQAHREIPDLCFGTDVIVGFPGESEQEFDETADLIRDNEFAYLHVFSYSNRQHAKSAEFAEQVPTGEIKRRSKILRDLSDRKRSIYMHRYLGQEAEVLFEQQKDGRWSGLTDTFIRVYAESAHDLENKLVPVRLDTVEPRALFATVL
ncbi:MAG TPA: tRNA (N(6)-L-threonylcarbamoyladenosine(37)-C(2))-methylthiotransferase MtaB [Lentisphaeria bacterium]|nr:tRNA (N(6)-L-threonylcarbamoyladenosine(37)-C(2))-methylthiotransferase MtaB [Lentisphaeria bacterium]